jgi:hypothetical protein
MEATPTENKQTEPLLGVKHKKHKWSDSLSFQSRLMIVFGLNRFNSGELIQS